MNLPRLIGFLVASVGIGTLCCCGPHSFGSGLRNIQNEMDSWSRGTFLALDVFAVFLIALSWFLYRGQHWARLVLMGGCISFALLAVIGAVVLGVLVSNVVDEVYVAAILICSLAGPVFLVFLLRQPKVIAEFGHPAPEVLAGGDGETRGCSDPERLPSAEPRSGR